MGKGVAMIYGLPNRAQFPPLIAAIVLGLLCGMLWDVLRIFRKLQVPSRTRLFFEDVLFFLICSLLSFAVCFAFNYGNVRGYILLAQVFGFFVWYCLPGRLADRTANALQKILRTLFLRPIIFVWRVFYTLRRRMHEKRIPKVKKTKKKEKKSKKNYYNSAKKTCK